MKYARELIVSTLVGGMFVVVPVYLAVLLLLKGMKSVASLVRPFAALLPEWIPAEVSSHCCWFRALLRRRGAGAHQIRACGSRAAGSDFFERLPGYGVLRSLTQRLAGDTDQDAWKPALIEIEDALVPGFVIEELPDGRFTVFVPSVPTPFAGAVYVLVAERVHLVDVPFTQAISSNLPLGLGIERLVAAMQSAERSGAASNALRV